MPVALVLANAGAAATVTPARMAACKKQGTTLIIIDADGTNLRNLPVGPPYTATATGHECFVADTGKAAFTVCKGPDGKMDSRFPQGNLFTAAPT